MGNEAALVVQRDRYLVATVSFDARVHNTYDYYVPEWLYDESIEVGDTVIVLSPYTGYQSVKVKAMELREDRPQKPIVCLIDTSEFEKEVQKLQRKQYIEERLVELIKVEERNQTFEKLAESNGEARDLFEELKAMS